MTLLVRPRVKLIYFLKPLLLPMLQLTTVSRKPSVESSYDFKLLQFGCLGFYNFGFRVPCPNVKLEVQFSRV